MDNLYSQRILGPVGLQIVKCLLALLGTHPGNPHYTLYNIQDADASFLKMMVLLRNLVFGQPFLYHLTPSKSSNNNDLVDLKMICNQFSYLEASAHHWHLISMPTAMSWCLLTEMPSVVEQQLCNYWSTPEIEKMQTLQGKFQKVMDNLLNGTPDLLFNLSLAG